jgi:hypothetical protein
MNLPDLAPRLGSVSSRNPFHIAPLKRGFHEVDSDVICAHCVIKVLVGTLQMHGNLLKTKHRLLKYEKTVLASQ